MKGKTSFSDSVLSITAKENWDLMYFQFQYYFADSLLNWPKDSIRVLVKKEDQTLAFDSLLFSQRRSTAVINYTGVLTDSAEVDKILSLNLKTAIALENWELANKALYEIYNSDFDKAALMFDPYVFQACLKEMAICQNAAAVYSQVYNSEIYKIIEFLNNWLTKSDELSLEAKSNILHVYTLVNAWLLDRWDVASSRLANVIHPEKVDIVSPEKLQGELVLNLHLSFIQYYGQINDGPGISKSFYFIADYFKEHSLSQEDDVDVCLFFNNWSMYQMTVDYLLPKFKNDNINERGVFLLMKTWFFYGDKNNSHYLKVHEKAFELNPDLWCKYINVNFQILRNEKIKKMFCSSCF